MSRHPAEWQGILDEDEEILWQGQPSGAVKVEFDSPMDAVTAVFFVGFSIFWMFGAAQAGGVFWMFGLLFFGIGLYKLIGQHFWMARQRKSTFYTLTDKRAFIAKTSATGTRSLDSYPIDVDTQLKFEEQGGLASIFFASEQVSQARPSFIRINNVPLNTTRTVSRGVGFQLLPDGREVYALMRGVQNAATDT